MTLHNRYVCLVLVLATVFLFSCGGGTRGSGGRIYNGFVGASDGRALSEVTVTVAATGDSAVTNSAGVFEISSASQTGAVEFLLESPSFTGRATTPALTADDSKVFVAFTVPSGAKPVIRVDIEVRERRPSRPTPAPTRGEPGRPTASPTPDNDDSGDDDSGDRDDDQIDDDSSGGGSGGGDSSGGSSDPEEGEVIDSEGAISLIIPEAVVVNGITFVPSSGARYRNKDGRDVTLQSFTVGMRVRARGRYTLGQLVLERLEER